MMKFGKIGICVLALQLSLQFASPANATRLSAPKTYKCSIGGEEYKYSELLSMTTHGMRLDGKPVGPLSFVHAPRQCPGNGLVEFKDNFSKSELKKLKKIIESKEFKEARQNKPVHYLLFLELDRGGFNKQHAAYALLQSTWNALISTASIDYENETNKQILQEFVNYIDKNSKDFDQYSKIQYQIYAANSERVLGQFEKAQARLDKIKNKIPAANPKENFNPENLINHINNVEKAINDKSNDPYYGVDGLF